MHDTRAPIKFSRYAASVLLLTVMCATAGADQTVVVRSGNGAIGTQDSLVHVLPYGRDGDITPSAADFSAAQTAPVAYIVAPYATYIPQLPSDPQAKWVATTPGLNPESALYAIPFQVTDTVIAAATLDLPYSVDNAINGVYINGRPISGSSSDGDYHAEYRFVRSDIAPLLRPDSTNWLYLNVSDYGGLAALIFRATFTIQGGASGEQSISPTTGGNTGSVSVRIISSGSSGFQAGAVPKLTGVGPDIVGSGTVLQSSLILTTVFNLTGAQPGLRTVTVTNADGSLITLEDAFTVQEGGGSDIHVSKTGGAAVHGRNVSYYIIVQNTGNVDANNLVVTEYLEPWFRLVSADPTPTLKVPLDAYFPASALGTKYDAILTWTIPTLGAQTSKLVAYTVRLDATMPVGQTVKGGVCVSFNDAESSRCQNDFYGCFPRYTPACTPFLLQPELLPECLALVGEHCTQDYAICMAGAVRFHSCASNDQPVRGSVDPNDIFGPPGIGSQRWITGKGALLYMTSFENQPTATAPAQEVFITHQLDLNVFDPSAFSFGPITFGSVTVTPPIGLSSFNTTVDLRPSKNLLVSIDGKLDTVTGTLKWTFRSLDPATGQLPTDPLNGFLPPDKNPPAGEGSVTFTITPWSTLTTGAILQNQASIVFDVHSPIVTPQWLNTVDNTKPTSQVSPLSATQSAVAFPVQWAGVDAGSGVGTFTVYRSDNAGPFNPWLVDTATTQATFTGKAGHTYAFYSVARDLTGNVENKKPIAEATTTINAAPPSIKCTGCYFLENTIRATFAFNVNTQGAPSTFAYNYRDSMKTVQFASSKVVQVAYSGDSATFSGQGSLNGQPGYAFSVTAKDGGGVGSNLDTISVLIRGPNNYSYSVSGTVTGGDIILGQ